MRRHQRCGITSPSVLRAALMRLSGKQLVTEALNIIEAMDDPALFEPWFRGPTWNPWRVVLKAIFALPMSDEERAFFRSIADRDPPAEPCKEVWIIAGRRAG